MNLSAKTLMTAMFAAALPFAATVSHAQGSLTVSCASPHLPSQQAVGKLLELDNFGQVYSARARLMQDIQRACHKGAAQVIVSHDISENPSTRWPHVESRIAETTNSASANHTH